MNVRDFKNGLKVAFITFLYGSLMSFCSPFILAFISGLSGININENDPIVDTLILIIMSVTIILSIIGFIVNYTPLSVKEGVVTIPASDQIRTFLDFITINPMTGLYRRRKYSVNDIQNVANGYTRLGRGTKNRTWNVVITGLKKGKSFSQRIDVSNKQVRDEVRNVLKQTISGKVNAEFSY